MAISMETTKDLQDRAINTIRFLSADAVQTANSGHPGLPMGAAAIAYTIWTKHLRHNPTNPQWPGRDRFILSGGHGSMLLYSLLYLTGYDIGLDEIKKFRQWGSKTPGHPEYGLTPGVEVTTGPLGQGFGNGVGMAITANHLAAVFNRPGHEIIDHKIFAIVTDGDLMEGVASEAASLAGHLMLGPIIYIYDDNKISIDGSTDLAFTEDRGKRFEAYGWQVLNVENGNNIEELDSAINRAKYDPRPSLIIARTQIGYGLPTKQNTAKAHGEPPGEEELNGAKHNLNWPERPRFFVPDDVLEYFRKSVEIGEADEKMWEEKIQNYKRIYPDLFNELDRRLAGELPVDWEESVPVFNSDDKGIASRVASGKVINAISEKIPELLGGSADLTPSNKTWIEISTSFQPEQYWGRNFHFGVREHGMGAIINGMAVHGGVIPYGGTFLVFSDYMRPSIRLSALSGYPSIWIFTHDSIGLGEDGPTHQPVEQLTALRAIPNMVVIRPADANEVSEAWKLAIKRRDSPTALILSRQSIPTLDREIYASAVGVSKGAYVLKDYTDRLPDMLLMASGSEVNLIIEASKQLAKEDITSRVISFPSWELFELQSEEYKSSVLQPEIKKRISVEAGISLGWEKWIGDQGVSIAVDKFGASAPYLKIFEEYGMTVQNIIEKAKKLVVK